MKCRTKDCAAQAVPPAAHCDACRLAAARREAAEWRAKGMTGLPRRGLLDGERNYGREWCGDDD